MPACVLSEAVSVDGCPAAGNFSPRWRRGRRDPTRVPPSLVTPSPSPFHCAGRQAALEYGRRHLTAFQGTHMPKIQQLMGALCFAGSAHVRNPYEETMSDSMWDALARDFVIQACSLLGQVRSGAGHGSFESSIPW